jgi:hypothetical protein
MIYQRKPGQEPPTPRSSRPMHKVGDYANSWNDSHPQPTASDVHTSSGGMIPGLFADKSQQNKAGGPKPASSSKSPHQGAQWQQERIRRGLIQYPRLPGT